MGLQLMKSQREFNANRLAAKVAMASGATAVALLGSGVAQAGIVASQVLPLRPSATPLTNVAWDVDGDSQVEFFLRNGRRTNLVTFSTTFGQTDSRTSVVTYAMLNAVAANLMGDSSVAKLPAGAVVGPSAELEGSHSNTVTMNGNSALDGWQMGETGFFGFSFQSNGQTVYAWAELALDPTSANTAGYGFQILRAYYDDTGAPIIVGNTGGGGSPVPEPSTYALALLAAGGVAAYRSRRKTVAA
jgi:hypothetical protein